MVYTEPGWKVWDEGKRSAKKTTEIIGGTLNIIQRHQRGSEKSVGDF